MAELWQSCGRATTNIKNENMKGRTIYEIYRTRT